MNAAEKDSSQFSDSISRRIRKVFAATASASSLFLFDPIPSYSLEPTTIRIAASESTAQGALLNEVWKIVNDNFVDSEYNGNDWGRIKTDYTERIRNGADEHELTKKMLQSLGDKYTRLLDKEFYESLYKYDAIGVGLLFQSDPGQRMIISAPPIAKSSGDKAGIRKGDLVFEINGRSTDGMTAMQALDLLSNDESDQLTMVVSHDSEGKRTVTLARVKPEVTNPVSFYSQEVPYGPDGRGKRKVGYVKLSDFSAEAVPRMRTALTSLELEHVDTIVLDLRGNTGGGFQFALNIGGMFMDDKQMVTAAGRDKEKNIFKTSFQGGSLTKAPLVLWVDELSASASEVLAGGLHDNCRAAIVGSKTFGKGKIQAVFGLSDGEGLTMTVAQYVTPKGSVIQSNGIQPDLPIDSMNAYVNLMVGSVFNRPNLSAIDYGKVEEYFKTCEPSKL